MYADLGPGQMLDLDPPSPNGVDLLYSHEYVANRMRRQLLHPRTLAERTNLYSYVTNNPVNYTDPSGLKKVCGFYVWLYTGLGWCVEENVYQAALDAAGRTVLCWWDCEVTVHKCALTYLGEAAAAGATTGFTHQPIPKPLHLRIPGARDVTTLQSRLAYELNRRGHTTVGRMLRLGAREAKLRPISSGVKSGIAGVALVEAGISIYCGWKCS